MADKIIVPRRIEDWFKPNGDFTLRALRFFEDITGTSNEVVQEIEDETGIGSLNAQVLRIQKQVGSGLPLTIDTTGFTVDTTKQTTDATEV